MTSMIYYSSEPGQQIIEATPSPENQELLDVRIRNDIETSRGEIRLSSLFLEERQAGERFLQVFQEHLCGCFNVAPRFLPSVKSEVTFEALPHYIFVFDTVMNPWLPKRTLDLLKKMKERALSEREAIYLMSSLANRATEHYGLEKGKFVAITFRGKIVEVADTKIDLLKKIQGKRYSDQIFVWEVGSESFTGWKR